jgi:hypothetical protein
MFAIEDPLRCAVCWRGVRSRKLQPPFFAHQRGPGIYEPSSPLIVIVADHRGWGAARTSRLCCGEPEKRQHSRQFGNHLRNPDSICILSFAVSFA